MNAVTLKIIHPTEQEPDAEPQERSFEQEKITIGRNPDSVLQLFDPLTMRVSRDHARIERRDGTYYLADAQSRNGTYLNDEKLPPEQPSPLREGDWIKIGDFALQFFPPRLEPPAADEAPADLQKLDGQLQQELARLNARLQTMTVERDQLLARRREAENIIQALREENNRLQAAAPVSPAAIAGSAAEEHLHAILDLVLDAVARLLPSPNKFSNALEGTTVRPGGFFLLHKNSGPELKELLLRGGDSAQERAELLPLLKHALDRVIAHQVALFEGYQMCARQAPGEILELLAPAKISQLAQEKQSGGLAKALPFLAARELWQTYCDEHKRCLEEDRKFYVQRIFQPIFMKTYFERMAKLQMEPEEKAALIT